MLGFTFCMDMAALKKTFLSKTLFAALRSQVKIVFYVASSGIAYLLLHIGKIVHSTNKQSTCNITQHDPRENLLRATSLFIWDEAPIMNRLCSKPFD